MTTKELREAAILLHDWFAKNSECIEHDWNKLDYHDYKEINLDWKDWENVQVFFRRFHDIIIEPGTTVEFIIRLMRSKRLPANEHIVNEMLQHRKITLKGVYADELS